MKQHKLTEKESRELAKRFADRRFGSFGGKTLEQWFADYMKEYNSVMDVIDKYNQSVQD